MCPPMKGAIDLSNTPHEIEHIRGCNGAYWPNCVSRKKDTIQQSSAGVPISLLPKPDSRDESLYHSIKKHTSFTVKEPYASSTNTIRSLYHHIPSQISKDVATDGFHTEP